MDSQPIDGALVQDGYYWYCPNDNATPILPPVIAPAVLAEMLVPDEWEIFGGIL